MIILWHGVTMPRAVFLKSFFRRWWGRLRAFTATWPARRTDRWAASMKAPDAAPPIRSQVTVFLGVRDPYREKLALHPQELLHRTWPLQPTRKKYHQDVLLPPKRNRKTIDQNHDIVAKERREQGRAAERSIVSGPISSRPVGTLNVQKTSETNKLVLPAICCSLRLDTSGREHASIAFKEWETKSRGKVNFGGGVLGAGWARQVRSTHGRASVFYDMYHTRRPIFKAGLLREDFFFLRK